MGGRAEKKGDVKRERMWGRGGERGERWWEKNVWGEAERKGGEEKRRNRRWREEKTRSVRERAGGGWARALSRAEVGE